MSTINSPDPSKPCAVALDKIDFILKVAPIAVGVDQMEPLFDDLLKYILTHPECKSVLLVKLERLLDTLPEGVDDLLQFTKHELRWSPVKRYVEDCLAVEVDITRRARYESIAEAFEKDWKHRDLYLRYDPTRDD